MVVSSEQAAARRRRRRAWQQCHVMSQAARAWLHLGQLCPSWAAPTPSVQGMRKGTYSALQAMKHHAMAVHVQPWVLTAGNEMVSPGRLRASKTGILWWVLLIQESAAAVVCTKKSSRNSFQPAGARGAYRQTLCKSCPVAAKKPLGQSACTCHPLRRTRSWCTQHRCSGTK